MCKLKGLKWIKSDRTRELTIPYNVRRKKKKIIKCVGKRKENKKSIKRN